MPGRLRRRRAAHDRLPHRRRLPDLAARAAWASSRSTRRPSPAGTGGRRGCRRTRCASASTSATTSLDYGAPEVAEGGDARDAHAAARRTTLALQRRRRSRRISRRTAADARSHLAARFFDDIDPALARQGRTGAPRRSSARCATCCSPAPTPSCLMTRLRPHALRRLPPDERRRARALARRSADAPPGDRARARAAASPISRPRRCRSRGCSRRPPPRRRPRPTRRVLVTVFLPGGCDLLDTLAADRRLRPLRRPAQAIRSTRRRRSARPALGMHPSLAQGMNGGVKGLFDAGKVGFLPGIDYANPDLSHFHSRHFWETGLVTERRRARLARPLARPPRRPRTTRSRACRSPTGSRPCCATARAPVAALDLARRRRALDPRRLGRRPTSATMDAYGAASPAQRERRRARARPTRRRAWPRRSATGSRRTPSTTTSTRSRRPSPTRRTTTSASASRASPR